MSPEAVRNLALILGRDPFERPEEVQSPTDTDDCSDSIGSAVYLALRYQKVPK